MSTTTHKRAKVLQSSDQVMERMSKQAPSLLGHCFMDRDWIWICGIDLRGEHNLKIREAIKEIGFRFSPGGHLMQDGKTRGHWGHSCLKPMGRGRKGKGQVKGQEVVEEEVITDFAAAFRSLGM